MTAPRYTARGAFHDTLTQAERAVVAAMCVAGATNRELAVQLVVAEQTIKFHLTNAMHKTGVQNRTALALWWIRCGQYEGVTEPQEYEP